MHSDTIPRYKVSAFVGRTLDLDHAPYIYAGISELATQLVAIVDWVFSEEGGTRRLTGDALTLPCEITNLSTRQVSTVCFDLRDRSDHFALPLLQHCDVYFKRNYFRPHLALIPPEYALKVLPFGLNYRCRSRAATWAAIKTFWYQMRHSDCRTLPHLLQQLAGVRRYLSYQDVSNFEILPDTVVHPTIFFQTRLWEQSQTEPDSAAEINEGRVEVIRTLRSAFGEQFVGGLMPTPLAKQAYPDLVLTPDETRPANYVRRSQSSLVVIYTRGLHHSLAFKLAEDLAGSHCIVSEPLRNELPVSLEEGRHYLRYNNPEDCVAQCQRLLADPAMAAQMRHNNWRYYQAEVKPAVRLRKCLEQAFAAHAASYKEIYSSSSCASNKPR